MASLIRKATIADIDLLHIISPNNAQGYFERCLQERDIYVIFSNSDGSNSDRPNSDRIDSHNIEAGSDQSPAGYAMLNWHPKYQSFRTCDIPEIQDLIVSPEYRRRGYATTLIHYCENIVKQAGKDMIGIGVGLTRSYGNAQRLYAKNGYVPDGNGAVYDRVSLETSYVSSGRSVPLDDDLCLMLVKDLGSICS